MIRRISHLSVSEDVTNAVKVLENMRINLEKEYFSLNEHIKSLDELRTLMDKA